MEQGPVVNGEQFPVGYTPEAAAYEQATRPVAVRRTVQLTFLESGNGYGNPYMYGRNRHLFKPVAFKEWTAIEKKCQKPFTAKWPKRPVGFNGSPAVLEDGRTVNEVLDERTARLRRNRAA
jgi:hypothetical protein